MSKVVEIADDKFKELKSMSDNLTFEASILADLGDLILEKILNDGKLESKLENVLDLLVERGKHLK